MQNKWCLSARKNTDILTQGEPSENGAVVENKTSRNTRRTATRTRKKAKDDVPPENSESVLNTAAENEKNTPPVSSEDNEKTPRRTRKKGITLQFHQCLASSNILCTC